MFRKKQKCVYSSDSCSCESSSDEYSYSCSSSNILKKNCYFYSSDSSEEDKPSAIIPKQDIPEEDINSTNLCVICEDKPVSIAIIPCGHALFCLTCIDKYKSQNPNSTCPTCRKQIKDILRIYY